MRQLIIIALVFISCIPSQAQISSEQEYRIDASQRPASPRHAVSATALYFHEAGVNNLAVVVNGKLYQADLLTRLMPYIQNNKYKIELEIIKDPVAITRYGSKEGFEKLLVVKMPRKLARRLRREHHDFLIN